MAADESVRLELFSRDVPALRAFFESAFGFVTERNAGGYVEMTLGSVRLGLADVKDLPPGHPLKPDGAERLGLGVEIVIETENVDGAYARAFASGSAIASGLAAQPWGLRDFLLLAPDGFYVRVTSRG